MTPFPETVSDPKEASQEKDVNQGLWPLAFNLSFSVIYPDKLSFFVLNVCAQVLGR